MKDPETGSVAKSNLTPGAIRMRYLRDRRRRGYRCYGVELGVRDIDRLIARGFLDRLHRDDPVAIERALGALLDQL